MATLDEITKEKQRLGEALARVDSQREKLTSQLSELEAAERVLARYGKDTPAAKTASARTPTTATKPAAPARGRGRRPAASAKTRGRQAQLNRTSAIGCYHLQPAERSRKSPQHAKALARTISVPPLPGTSGLAASNSATGSSTPDTRWERRNAPRSDTTEKARRAGS